MNGGDFAICRPGITGACPWKPLVCMRSQKRSIHLSTVMQYGDIRNIDTEVLKPVTEQLFYRACLLLVQACICDDEAAGKIAQAMEWLNTAAGIHDFLNQERLGGYSGKKLPAGMI